MYFILLKDINLIVVIYFQAFLVEESFFFQR